MKIHNPKLLQRGFVYTNENCIGCNKCISVCPVITANKAMKKKGSKFLFYLHLHLWQIIQMNTKGSQGGLKKLGVNWIISVSFGADITTWAYISYIKSNNFKGGISQPCPTVVNYIEHYRRERAAIYGRCIKFCRKKNRRLHCRQKKRTMRYQKKIM